MNNLSILISHEIEKIERVIENKDSSSTNVIVGKDLIERFKTTSKLPKLSVLSEELNLSNSSISKFLKMTGIENYQVLKYLFDMNLNLKTDKYEQKPEFDKKIIEAAKAIVKAKRVRFIATGNSLLMIKDFANKLAKRDFNVYVFNSEGDQAEQLSMLEPNDALVMLSFSQRSAYIKKIINQKHNFSKIIFSAQPEKPEWNAIYFEVGEPLESKFRKDTFEERIQFLRKSDAIIKAVDICLGKK